ncbi:MAG TPA: hypothetical protein VE170_17510, partial [Candidatus Limnocylindria bacterium]|nr:hypothetical protein [Candidatus Limnocylindria bacterium]
NIVMITTTLPDRPCTEDRSLIGRHVAVLVIDQSAVDFLPGLLILSYTFPAAGRKKGERANARHYDGV